MNATDKTHFAPQLFIKSGITDVSFYEKAFGAIELRRFSNDDGTVHVAEFSIDGAMFHLHEEKESAGHVDPQKINGITTLIGLFVKDVDETTNAAIAAGGVLVSKPESFEYGYRQSQVKDPFGHTWLLEMKIS